MPDKETFTDMSFPEQGLDLSHGFGMQMPGTTPVGNNVRTYDPGQDRARGGSRAGLVKFTGRLPTNGLVQHLNIVVDVSPEALLDDFDSTADFGEGGSSSGEEFDGSLDESSPGPEDIWGNDIEYETDQNGHRTRRIIRITRRQSRVPRRYIRHGGTGRQPNKNTRNHTPPKQTKQHPPLVIHFVQVTTQTDDDNSNTLPAPMPQNVTAGNLLVAVISSGARGEVGPISFSLSDSQGNAWHQIGSYVRHAASDPILDRATGLSIWYTIAGSSDQCTLTWTPSPALGPAPNSGDKGSAALEFMEFDTVKPTPLDGTQSNTGNIQIGGTTISTGSVPVSGAGRLVVAAFASEGQAVLGLDYTAPADFTALTYSMYKIGLSAARAVVADVQVGIDNWCGMGASFKPKTK